MDFQEEVAWRMSRVWERGRQTEEEEEEAGSG